MSGALTSTSEGSTLILTLSDPAHKNALGPDIYAAGIEVLNAAENNPEIRSVVITGEGAVFCEGGNLQRLQANRRESPEVQAQSIEALHNWIDAIRTYPKPVIAAVEGAAAGAGFSLALACDFIVAAGNAVAYCRCCTNFCMMNTCRNACWPIRNAANANSPICCIWVNGCNHKA